VPATREPPNWVVSDVSPAPFTICDVPPLVYAELPVDPIKLNVVADSTVICHVPLAAVLPPTLATKTKSLVP
jgi:hypothetical protein